MQEVVKSLKEARKGLVRELAVIDKALAAFGAGDPPKKRKYTKRAAPAPAKAAPRPPVKQSNPRLPMPKPAPKPAPKPVQEEEEED